MSGSQIDKLGTRIRDSEVIDPEDLALLQALLVAHDDVLSGVAAKLREIGLSPTTRLKTSGTIIDKLKRERRLTLRGIHDLAGARLVQDMTLKEQDELVGRVMGLWPDARLLDRRAEPSHGYRAVHVIVRVAGCWVEIQIRTHYQDTWAQVMEFCGDTWGRGVRYGEPPANPEEIFNAALTRGQLIELWRDEASELVATLEAIETQRQDLCKTTEAITKQRSLLERRRADGDPSQDRSQLQDLDRTLQDAYRQLEELDQSLEAEWGPWRDRLAELRDTIMARRSRLDKP